MAPGGTSLLSLPLARCWVLDRVDPWAVVMFIDFGQLATIPVQSLRSLDSDDFGTIPPTPPRLSHSCWRKVRCPPPS